MKSTLAFLVLSSFALFAGALTLPALAHQPVQSLAGDDDTLPWPWGSECPFPWSDIQGVWRAYAPDMDNGGADHSFPFGYYEFKVKNEWTNGTKVIEVIKYNSAGEIEGRGQGYSSPEQRIVRAIVLGEGKSRMLNHRVIVRAYNRDSTLTCGGELVTVLTTRPVSDEEGSDRHYVLVKEPLVF